MHLSPLPNIDRLKQICVVLTEEEFGALLGKVKLAKFIPVGKRLRSLWQKQKQTSPEVRLRKTLERLGPTFIKLGQLLSIRPDLVPKKYIHELEKLQEDVPAISFGGIDLFLAEQLGDNWRKNFATFDERPIAAASISQVYKATLRSGKKVVVKVRRPGIDKVMKQDILLMQLMAKLLEKHVADLRKFRPVGVVEEFKKWTEKELDFLNEAANAQHFAENFKNVKHVKIPKVYTELTTPAVLTLEYLDGVHLHDIKSLKRKKHINPEVVIGRGFNIVMTQVFMHGFFHADPHPGNFIVLKNSVIGLVDFGIVGHFDKTLKRISQDILVGIITQDAELIVDSLMKMGLVDEDSVDMLEFRQSVLEAVEPFCGGSVKNVRMGFVLEEVLDIAVHHRVRIPTSFVLLGKTVVTLEGVALQFDPEFDIMKHTKPFIEKMMRQKLSPQQVAATTLKNARRLSQFLADLPERTAKVFDRLEKGKYTIHFENQDLQALSAELDHSSNRIAFGLIIGALVVGGSFLSTVGPLWAFGLSAPSFVLFGIAAVMAIGLLMTVIKENRRW